MEQNNTMLYTPWLANTLAISSPSSSQTSPEVTISQNFEKHTFHDDLQFFLYLSLHQYDSSSLVVIWLKQWLLLKLHKAQKQNKLRNWDRDNKQWLHRLSSRWVSHSWNYQACSSEMISEWRGCCLLVSGRLIKALSLFCLVKTEIVWAPLACWFDGRLLLWSFHFVLSFIWPWIDFYLPNSPFSFAPFYLSVTLFSNLMQKPKQDYRRWIKMQISKSNSSSSLPPPFLVPMQ